MPTWLKFLVIGCVVLGFGVVGGGVYMVQQKKAAKLELIASSERAEAERETQRMRAEAERERAEAERIELAIQEVAAEQKAARQAIAAQRDATERAMILAAEKAEAEYRKYRASADEFANELLKVLTAVDVGITQTDYLEMIQELSFKHALLPESRHASQRSMSAATEHLKSAVDLWRRMLTANPNYKWGETAAMSPRNRLKEQLHSAWALAAEEYAKAVATMAQGN